MIDFDRLNFQANEWKAAYLHSRPFPHVIIDGAFREAELGEAVAAWPTNGAWKEFQNGKRCLNDINRIPAPLARILLFGNSPRFVTWLSQVTGIDGLIPDSSFGGAGLHEIGKGASLGVHVDFNQLGNQPMYRRLNVLLYLNAKWAPSWGGALELWERPDDPQCYVKIAPTFNRLVIFESSERSWHGHPKPLTPPAGESRKSLAWYFYTSEPGPGYLDKHSTVYVGKK